MITNVFYDPDVPNNKSLLGEARMCHLGTILDTPNDTVQ